MLCSIFSVAIGKEQQQIKVVVSCHDLRQLSDGVFDSEQ